MIYPDDFFLSLKLTLISKLRNANFQHVWKDIVTNQLKYPHFSTISIENGLQDGCSLDFTTDLLGAYQDWKSKASIAHSTSIDHCVWKNKCITDVGRKLWNVLLIERNILYVSDFLTENFSVMSYNDFRVKWGLSTSDISSLTYVNIKMALRRYDCPTVPVKAFSCISKSTITYRPSENRSVQNR